MISWIEEFQCSIKSWEAEDRFDLYFYRPLGFLFAKLGSALRITPNVITLASMASGVAAGIEFSRPHFSHWLAGSLLLLLSGILDSADGQLARLTGHTSSVGLVLDGLCDNIVFISVYLGCMVPLYPSWGIWILPIAVAAGVSHSLQSAAFDFYLREYLFYTKEGFPEAYRNPDLPEAARQSQQNSGERWIWKLRYLWLRQQQLVSTRDECFRLTIKPYKKPLGLTYRRFQISRIRQWRWLGSNSHTLGIIICSYLMRFDIYLIFVNLIALNAWMLAAWWWQRDSDRHMLAEIQAHVLK